MNAISHNQSVLQQFNPRAAAYLNSSVHAQGEDLQQFAAIVGAAADQGSPAGAKVLDLGCGGGHVSFAVASYVKQVIAYDLSREMLAVVGAHANERGLPQLSACQGRAESLPFESQYFDFVLSRYSAHHWEDLGQALREVWRVLKPGGSVVFADVVSPGNVLLDSWLQTVEMIRDSSHVRDYSVAQWLEYFTHAGFVLQSLTTRRLQLEFASWVARMNTPEQLVTALQLLLAKAPATVKTHFAIQDDGSFTCDTATLVLSRPG